MNAVQRFVADVFERALKTGAQAALLTAGAQQLNILHADWRLIAGYSAGGFITSILTSLASLPVGDKSSPSVLPTAVAPATAVQDTSLF